MLAWGDVSGKGLLLRAFSVRAEAARTKPELRYAQKLHRPLAPGQGLRHVLAEGPGRADLVQPAAREAHPFGSRAPHGQLAGVGAAVARDAACHGLPPQRWQALL